MSAIRKAVLPVAGLGTRVLPGAKTTPKNLLNVVDRPILSYVVAEARAAGIEHFVFVTGRGKGGDRGLLRPPCSSWKTQLEAKGKTDMLADVPGRPGRARRDELRAPDAPLGLGHAVWCARDMIGDEPFAVILPDMLMRRRAAGAGPGGRGLRRRSAATSSWSSRRRAGEAHKYGIVALDGRSGDGRLAQMTGMVEKPAPGTEPSNLFITGRYILQPEIFELLAAPGRRRRRRDPADRRHGRG